jgi:glycosyltransferase involved in cell wall biosynthesis
VIPHQNDPRFAFSVRRKTQLVHILDRSTLQHVPALAARGGAVRVAFVNHVGSAAGGAEQSLLLFLGALPARIEPLVVLFEDGDFANRLRVHGYRVELFYTSSRVLSSTREAFGLSGAFDALAAALRLAGLFRSRGISLVHTNSVKAHFIGAVAARLAGIPSIVHVHDILTGPPLVLLRIVAASCSRERIACSRAVANTLRLPHTTVINEPIDTRQYERLPSRDDARSRFNVATDVPLVAIVGRIKRWKGHDRFLRIAARVRQRTKAHFLIVGSPVFRDADFLPELHRLAEELKITQDVTFISWLDEPSAIYAAIDLHCNCSTREPFGRTAVEAAAAGVPTVCFKDGGTSETIIDGQTGIAVTANDEAAFADAVVGFLTDGRKLARAREAAREFSRNFDIAHAGRRFNNVTLRAVRRAV